MNDIRLERVEAAMEGILEATSGLRYEDVELVTIALDAGWLTVAERKRLQPLRSAFNSLLPYDDS